MNGTRTLTTRERRLVAAISRWRRENGWTQRAYGWTNREDTVAVDFDHFGFRLRRRVTPARNWQLNADFFAVYTVRQAVDVLVSLDVLPDQFHSIKWAVTKAFEAVDAEVTR